MDDINKLRALVAFLRDSNITYYKDASVELILGPMPMAPVKLAVDPEPEPLPEIYKRLPANYSHPSLFPKPRE